MIELRYNTDGKLEYRQREFGQIFFDAWQIVPGVKKEVETPTDNTLCTEQHETVGSELVKRLERFTAGLLSGEIKMPKGPPPGSDGFRTERVTLEVTHGNSLSAARWNWYGMVRGSLNCGESVRVIEPQREKRLDDQGNLCSARELGDRCTDLANLLNKRNKELKKLTDQLNAAEEECKRLTALLARSESPVVHMPNSDDYGRRSDYIAAVVSALHDSGIEVIG